MKFKIEYTGNKQKHNEPPCEGATQQLWDSPYWNGGTWESQPHMAWVIDIASLEELVTLSKKIAPIIVSGNTLEIYDF